MILHCDNTERLKAVYYKLFNSLDPFSSVGKLDYAVRLILFPTNSYHLTSEQFRALVFSANKLGESSFYISEVEARSDPFIESKHWMCSSPTFEEYDQLPLGVENAIYSLNGTWGIILSHELHALLVCHSDFGTTFKQQYPKWEEDHSQFIQYWNDNKEELGSNIEWLESFLAHLSPK